MSATNVLAFPVQVSCPVCHRATTEADLSACMDCDAKYCGQCHECDCDRLTADLADRLQGAFWRKVRGWFRLAA
jgi:hypothetical protein